MKNIVIWSFLALFLIVGSQSAMAAFLRKIPQTVQQPDGKVLHIYASGDEHYNWLHDAGGYVIKQDSQGWYTYGRKTSDGDIVPTRYRVNEVDPSAVGLEKDIRMSPEKIREKFGNIDYRRGGN